LLSSPPKDYESFVVAIETRDNVPAFENLCLTLKEKGERRDGGRVYIFLIRQKEAFLTP